MAPATSPDRAAVVAALAGARRVACTTHEKGDADGAGSALAVVRALRARGVAAVAVFPSPIAPSLSYLPGFDGAVVLSPGDPVPAAAAGADLVAAFDCGAARRLGAVLPLARAARAFLNIDHHASNDRYGTLAWVDAGYAATGVMALEILEALGAPLDADAALCLYAAVVTDTGSFSYSNTDPRTHRAAATLLAAGARPEVLTAALHRRRTEASWRLEAEAVARLRTADDGAVAWTTLDEAAIARSGVPRDDLPEVVHIPVSLAATRVAFVLTSRDGGRATQVSLRSRCAVGVHATAARLGGGGHPRAAGATLALPLVEAEARVLAEVRADLAALAAARGGGVPPQDA